ncbi:hypothetical protein B9Z55_011359 [Caenorhabditis nigoni]|uniref:F-box domain-containing protein n=2 Tax=Caenorhabditis nigoni TaxID=1611254 RepID=A0A2G5UK04_9PELO|nr:hypothetical protein B9Z55_011359 [Caenorhabditis nigoni]
MKNSIRFRRMRLDCITFNVTLINRRVRKLWSFLCRSFIAIPHRFSPVLSLIFWLFGVIKNFYFLLKSSFYQLRKSTNKQDRFPLLNLDYVAIREVLNTLDPIDYINFSKASKACRRLSTVKKPYKVELRFMNAPMLWFRNGSFCSCMKWIKSEKPGKFRTRGDPLDAMKKFYLEAKSLMGVEVDFVAIYMDRFGGQCKEVVDCLRSICQEFSVLRIRGTKQRQEDVQYILDNLKFKDSLYIVAKTTEELPLRIPETIDQLSIIHGSWITLDHIMSWEMSRILVFNDTHLTNQEINIIYKSWINMESHQNLECFEINLTNREDFVAVALRNIPYRMGPTIRISNYAAVEGSFEVTRKDGLTASICVYEFGIGFDAIMFTSPFLSHGKLVRCIP